MNYIETGQLALQVTAVFYLLIHVVHFNIALNMLPSITRDDIMPSAIDIHYSSSNGMTIIQLINHLSGGGRGDGGGGWIITRLCLEIS